VGCCRVGSLLTFDIPQTALVATLDTYDLLLYFIGFDCIPFQLYSPGIRPGIHLPFVN
jgi:hypothetical protein